MAPESEPFRALVAFGNGKEALAVIALHTGNKTVFAAKLYSPRIEHRIYPKALLKIRIGAAVKVKAPVEWDMFTGEHRICIAVVYAVVEIGYAVGSGKQLFLLLLHFKICGMYHGYLLSGQTFLRTAPLPGSCLMLYYNRQVNLSRVY